VDPQIDPSAERVGNRPRSDNGASASAADGHSAPVTDPIAIEPSRGSDHAMTRVIDDGDNFALLSPTARAASLVIIAFQLGYTALDRVEYPLTFPRTAPLHLASIGLGLIVLMAAMSQRPIRNWRAMALLVCMAVIASTARIAVLDGNSDVLVASIVLFLFATGALLPWSPRFQAALGASGVIAMFGYSMHAATLNSRLALDWTWIVTAMALAQIAAIHGARYRRRLATQLTELAAHQHSLRREIDLRTEAAAARERDHLQLQASEAMLRKVFEASPDNIAINSLVDGRFIAVNDAYRVAGYTRDDVMGANIIALGMWRHEEQLTRFVEMLRRDGHVKNMEVVQRCKNGVDEETHLISASATEVNGEPCVISMVRDITEIKRVETSLRASHAALRKIFDATLDIIVVTRLSDGAYIDFNQQFAQLGYGQ
jgi:PAS domain S-box-containing protein